MYGTEVLCLLVAVIVVLATCWYYVKKKTKYLDNDIPEIYLERTLLQRPFSDMLDVLLNCTTKYGGLIKLRFGNEPKILVADYKFTHFLLCSSNFIPPAKKYAYVRGGLLPDSVESRTCTLDPQIMTAAFQPQALQHYVKIFEIICNDFVSKLEKEIENFSIDIDPLVGACTLDNVLHCAVGFPGNFQQKKKVSSQYIREMCKTMLRRGETTVSPSHLTLLLSRDYYEVGNILRILNLYTRRIISTNIEIRQETESAQSDQISFFNALFRRDDDTGKRLTFKEISQGLNILINNGYKIASAVNFVLYCLANHPQVQERALEEQKRIFDNVENGQVDISNLNEMKYLEQVIKETLRLYPSFPLFYRQANQKVIYEGKIIPKGTNFLIFPLAIHKNPKYFPDAEKFDPSRFDPRDQHPLAYVPFSAGPTECIGQKFAMLEMKTILSKILRRFEVVPAIPKHEVRLGMENILKSVNGIRIGLRTRQ